MIGEKKGSVFEMFRASGEDGDEEGDSLLSVGQVLTAQLACLSIGFFLSTMVNVPTTVAGSAGMALNQGGGARFKCCVNSK